MLALPTGFRAIAPDMRGYGDTEPLPVDATLGLGDMVDDVLAMIDIRAVLERYAANGGSFREEVIADAGHSPFLEKPEEFNRLLLELIGG